jgi:stage II sporulation protein D
MRSALARSTLIVLLAQSLSSPFLISGQQPGSQETRPRRATTLNETVKAPRVEVWEAPPAQQVISLTDSLAAPTSVSEPTIRVALATNARSGTISTTGKLMNASGPSSTFTALNTGRIRVEPRLLSPLPSFRTAETYTIKIEGVASRVEAEQKARELTDAFDEDSKVTYDDESSAWGLIIKKNSRAEADELVARLNEAGYDASLVIPAISTISKQGPSQPAPGENIRLISRTSTPSREVVALTGGSQSLFSSSAPVLLASEDERTAPVRFNDRPYRGRLEVFANTRGTLTVVNVVGIEDYVRGVVANELSPGGYPALEALKAQAIAARTYALRNRGQFMAQGFDLLPTTRSQVYRGLSSEHPLSSRAVDETRGIVATHNGETINALYTSTCGGRTENSENIFNQPVPYLRSRECSIETQNSLSSFALQSSRDLPELREERNVPLAREIALLTLQNFSLSRSKPSDSWLSDEAPVNEVRGWLASVARLTRQLAPAVTEDVNRPGPFATALNISLYGESRADTLLNSADVEYFLAIRDAADVPAINRADVAALVKDGYLSVHPDATLRPREPLSRARVLHTIARSLEARGLFQLQKGTARPASQGNLVLRPSRGKEQTLKVSPDTFLFRQIGDGLYPVRSVIVVGGEPVVFHLSATGEVDYLEVRPAPNGAAAERFSPFTNWSTELSLGQVQGRLARAARGIGPIRDLRVFARGPSRRAIDLEIVGSQGVAHVRGGRIRSALGLREQLFVIERKFDQEGRVIGFTFAGRGWGHGVGMCQVGAYGLARQGWNHEKILKAYYTGIELTKAY